MKITRNNTFETNSSSTHVLCIPKEESVLHNIEELYADKDFELMSYEVFTTPSEKFTALVHLICSQYYTEIESYNKTDIIEKLKELEESEERINWNSVYDMIKSDIDSKDKKTVYRLRKLEEILHRQGIKYHIGDWAYKWVKYGEDENGYCNYNIELDGRQPMDGVDWLLEDDNRLLTYLSNEKAFYATRYDDYVFPEGIETLEEAEKETHYFYNGG